MIAKRDRSREGQRSKERMATDGASAGSCLADSSTSRDTPQLHASAALAATSATVSSSTQLPVDADTVTATHVDSGGSTTQTRFEGASGCDSAVGDGASRDEISAAMRKRAASDDDADGEPSHKHVWSGAGLCGTGCFSRTIVMPCHRSCPGGNFTLDGLMHGRIDLVTRWCVRPLRCPSFLFSEYTRSLFFQWFALAF